MMLATKVLLVDDYMPVRRTLRSLLLHVGFRNIDDAGDVDSALSRMRESPYGLVMSDLSMEPKSGLDFLREVRADMTLRDTPFILVTGYAAPADVLAAKEAGVTSYIVKPFNTATLKKKVRAALGLG